MNSNMDINESCVHLSPDKILDLELKSLSYFKVSPRLKSSHQRFTEDAANEFARLDAIKKAWLRQRFPLKLVNFESRIDTSYHGKELNIYFGGHVTADSNKTCTAASYYLTVCTSPNIILRKLHFDYDAGTGGNDPKPFYHLQLGGKLPPLMEANGFTDEGEKPLYSWLELPRVSFMPISLFSLTYLILREFEPENARLLFDENIWYGHLRDSEKALLLPFFSKCCKIIENKKSLYHEFLYHRCKPRKKA